MGDPLLRGLVMALLGVVLGAFGGFIGTGGGSLAIPALVLLLGFEQKLAQGTALVMVVPNVVKGLAKYNRRNAVDPRLAAALAASGSVAAFAFSFWAQQLSGPVLQKLYGAFLVLIAGFLLATRRAPAKAPLAWAWAVLPGLAGGVTLGLFGVGGALVAVPLLVLFFGQSQVKAQGLGLALALPGCLISLAQYAWHGQVQWLDGAVLALGGLAGVSFGVAWAHRIPERRLIQAFCVLLVALGAGLILRG